MNESADTVGVEPVAAADVVAALELVAAALELVAAALELELELELELPQAATPSPATAASSASGALRMSKCTWNLLLRPSRRVHAAQPQRRGRIEFLTVHVTVDPEA
ncbi:MAG TPA: hypothetical protein VKV27_10365 [Solirubrobacteraceae bacterium]|nr:hypothetical protein [Solirubrobacteraceae bacterium]